ncbi:MAG: hypothetical protein AAF380_02970, partial [Bacteroidota bacterium]
MMKKNSETSYPHADNLANLLTICTLLSHIGFSIAFRSFQEKGSWPSASLQYSFWEDPTKMLSVIHGFFSFAFALLYYKKYIRLHTWRILLSFSLGYFTFDLSKYYLFQAIQLDNGLLNHAIHHSMVIWIIIVYITKYPQLAALGFLSELTNVFLNIGLLMYKAQLSHLLSFKLVSLCLIVSFLWLRIYNFTKICFALFKRKAPKYELCIFMAITFM